MLFPWALFGSSVFVESGPGVLLSALYKVLVLKTPPIPPADPLAGNRPFDLVAHEQQLEAVRVELWILWLGASVGMLLFAASVWVAIHTARRYGASVGFWLLALSQAGFTLYCLTQLDEPFTRMPGP